MTTGRRAVLAALALVCLTAFWTGSGTARAAAPATFWGVNPVTVPTDAQIQQISAGGIGSIRVPLNWSTVQPLAGTPDWAPFDALIEAPARHHLQVLPVIWGSPSWVAPRPLELPVANLSAWSLFLRQAVMRYGPDGSFWAEHSAVSSKPLPYDPITVWQIWNEPNFFYFARPVSAGAYAKLIVSSHAAIAGVDPGAKLILGGMFANPKNAPPRAYSAVSFLDSFYGRKGIKNSFDGVALHPYARDASTLGPDIEAVRATMKENGDAGAGLWITEIGWGSAATGPFQKGANGQARELGRAFSLFLANRRRWHLEGVDWWSLTDDPSPTACNFCDHTGLFTAAFQPKPAWARFAALAGR
ncbi:MAG TPA: hypothetical protein VFX35_08430 [Solirubrobacterales bacterium]|nr:hypothetical protein [Solirubrobacterales bacterium]